MSERQESDMPKVFVRRSESDMGHGHYPFSYSAEESSFYIADQRVPAGEFNWGTCMKLNTMSALGGVEPEISDIASQALLIPRFGNIIGGRKLHEWIMNNSDRIQEEAIPVMKEVFSSLSGIKESELGDDRLWGFGAAMREDGTLHLNVIGDCACLDALPDSHVLALEQGSRFEKGFAEYSLHNIETATQLASIYSGIGHLARLATE